MYAQQRDCTYRIYRLQPTTHISEIFSVKFRMHFTPNRSTCPASSFTHPDDKCKVEGIQVHPSVTYVSATCPRQVRAELQICTLWRNIRRSGCVAPHYMELSAQPHDPVALTPTKPKCPTFCKNLFLIYLLWFIKYDTNRGKLDVIVVETWTGSEGSGRLGLPDFKRVNIWRWQGCQLYAPATFIPRKYFC